MPNDSLKDNVVKGICATTKYGGYENKSYM